MKNELRIGNFIETYRIGGFFKEHQIAKGFEIDDYDGESLDVVRPIQLTEEWLLKFGFIRQGGRNMWVKDKLCIELKELPNIRGEFIQGWYIGLKDLGNVLFHSFMKIESVHQLQNLIHALTGEELTIKE
jgi:hypothetical protein